MFQRYVSAQQQMLFKKEFTTALLKEYIGPYSMKTRLKVKQSHVPLCLRHLTVTYSTITFLKDLNKRRLWWGRTPRWLSVGNEGNMEKDEAEQQSYMMGGGLGVE